MNHPLYKHMSEKFDLKLDKDQIDEIEKIVSTYKNPRKRPSPRAENKTFDDKTKFAKKLGFDKISDAVFKLGSHEFNKQFNAEKFYYRFVYKDSSGAYGYTIIEVTGQNPELALKKFEKKHPDLKWTKFNEVEY